MNDTWITGTDDIVNFCKEYFGPTSWKTLRDWKKKYKFPIRYFPNGRPYLIQSEAQIWAVTFDNLKKENMAKKK